MVKCTIDGGEKGKDGERFRSNEEVSKWRGELSNATLLAQLDIEDIRWM
jgi:hypothetical protein